MDLIKSYASKCCTGQKKIAYCVDCGKELIIYKRLHQKLVDVIIAEKIILGKRDYNID